VLAVVKSTLANARLLNYISANVKCTCWNVSTLATPALSGQTKSSWYSNEDHTLIIFPPEILRQIVKCSRKKINAIFFFYFVLINQFIINLTLWAVLSSAITTIHDFWKKIRWDLPCSAQIVRTTSLILSGLRHPISHAVKSRNTAKTKKQVL